MKVDIFCKALVLIFCLSICNASIAAQQKPQPLLVDEIAVSDAKDFQVIASKIEKFLSRLAKEDVATRGYIDIPVNTEIGEKLKLLIHKNAALENRVLFWGKVTHPARFFSSLEIGLFLIPKGAEIPFRYINEVCVCPTLSINHSTNIKNRNSILTFVVTAQGGDVVKDISYQWKISAGKIISGQGTRAIKVDTTGTSEISATVQVGGILCDVCPREASSTVKIQ